MCTHPYVFDTLRQLGVVYTCREHPPVYTIDEMLELGLHDGAEIAKNLFLRDAKGHRHFLLMLRGHKRADLAMLQAALGTTRLSLASPERLFRYLGLYQGAVTPLGILNDKECAVEVVLDKDLVGEAKVGVHSCVNTATVFLPFADIVKVIEHHGNPITYVTIP